jgi:hypothetical protein
MILKAVAHTLDQQTGLLFHAPHCVAHLTMESQESLIPFSHDIDALNDFPEYCHDTVESSSSEPMVSFIKRLQNCGRETGPAICGLLEAGGLVNQLVNQH